MINYLKRHERYIMGMLGKDLLPEKRSDLLAYHDKQIQWLQHERLAHLIVMLFVCLFFLLSLGFTVMNPSLPGVMLSALLLILSLAYVVHYYRLENGLQRWYSLSNRIKLNHQS